MSVGSLLSNKEKFKAGRPAKRLAGKAAGQEAAPHRRDFAVKKQQI
ncbi:hypothetical protein [Polaromonas sp. OV174]|nr:hypothetical protein [Polaromonas sp. OV174]